MKIEKLNFLEKFRNFFLVFLIATLLIAFLIFAYSGTMSNNKHNQNITDSSLPVDMSKNITNGDSCVVTGCNGEICIDKEENEKNPRASICLWKEEYRCLRYSICEKQKDGKCGWTKTQEYMSCISNINAN